ncbi:MAG: FecR family protein [Bacteroidales bacterium]|nr:FecR family protein [Bacteroidales bacterium]MBN2819843.1 FecR family protein [Bacteroidales bacterium]
MKNIDKFKIAELIVAELKGELSESDRNLLNKWKNDSSENLNLYNKIVDENNIAKKITAIHNTEKEEAWNRLDKELQETKPNKIPFRSILKFAAAAAVILFISGTYLFLKHNSIPGNEKAQSIEKLIVSGTRKAILTTSDNQKIELGNAPKKRVFQLRKTSVSDTNSTLTFQTAGEEKPNQLTEIALNTIETPRGGEYSIILSEGTKVYLNAETRFIFPEVFTGKTREVELEGEAYFEVTKNMNQPFIVRTENFNIRVYGTSFNVSAYVEDKTDHTTLIEGSVELFKDDNYKVKLEPGQQAGYDKSTTEFYSKEVETYLYTDWKDGLFVFDNESLENIMNRLTRWYDFNTEYLDDKARNYHFTGTLNRYDSVDKILKMIALTSNISFEIKSDKIIVK